MEVNDAIAQEVLYKVTVAQEVLYMNYLMDELMNYFIHSSG